MSEAVSVAGLTVHFVGGEASDDVAQVAQRCFQGAGLPGPLTLTVRWAEPGACIRDLRLVVPACGEIRAAGPALLPALHKLCEHARSLLAAPERDRQRWQAARAARKDSGVYVAVSTLNRPY